MNRKPAAASPQRQDRAGIEGLLEAADVDQAADDAAASGEVGVGGRPVEVASGVDAGRTLGEPVGAAGACLEARVNVAEEEGCGVRDGRAPRLSERNITWMGSLRKGN